MASRHQIISYLALPANPDGLTGMVGSHRMEWMGLRNSLVCLEFSGSDFAL